MEKIILVDVDGTVASLYNVWYGRYNAEYDDDLTTERVTEWRVHEFVKPECGIKIYNYLSDPDLYDSVQPVDGAVDGVNGLKELGFRVVFLSSGIHPGKADFLRRYKLIGKGDDDIIIAHDKSLIVGDYLIDDAFHNIKSFRHGLGILFGDYAHNRECNYSPHAENWKDAVRIVTLLNNVEKLYTGKYE